MEKNDKACFASGRTVRKGFNIVKFGLVAKGAEAVIEAVGMSIEVPKFASSCMAVR